MTDNNPNPSRRLVAVVVTYNRLNQLQQTLARLLAEPAAQLEAVVVVDNASTDDTGRWLATQTDPRLQVLALPVNSGGAGGFSAGMRYAVDRLDPDWLVVMDDDARPAPGALAAFHALPQDKWDAVCAAVYHPDGPVCDMNRPARNPFWRWREFWQTVRAGRAGFHFDDQHFDGPPLDIDVASFVGLFLSRRAIALQGYPDPALFLYGDDALYTLELSAAGGRIGFEPGIRFDHDMSTYGDRTGPMKPLWKVYYYHRNLLLLYRKAAGWLFWPVLLVILPAWRAKRSAYGPDRATFQRLLNRAIRDGLRRDLSASHDDILTLAADPLSD